jgi:hypothetical protein
MRFYELFTLSSHRFDGGRRVQCNLFAFTTLPLLFSTIMSNKQHFALLLRATSPNDQKYVTAKEEQELASALAESEALRRAQAMLKRLYAAAQAPQRESYQLSTSTTPQSVMNALYELRHRRRIQQEAEEETFRSLYALVRPLCLICCLLVVALVSFAKIASGTWLFEDVISHSPYSSHRFSFMEESEN